MIGEDQRIEAWLAALRARHLELLTLQEVRRGLQALSRIYVQERLRLRTSALDGAGKRAAFALFYGPLHFAIIRAVVRRLDAHRGALRTIIDLGCGTGVAGAAWALGAEGSPRLEAVERSGWAAGEARWALERLGLPGRVRRGDLGAVRLPGAGGGIVAGYTVNELEAQKRDQLLRRLLDATARGARLLIIEPIAKRPVPWWDSWVRSLGARADSWELGEAELAEQLTPPGYETLRELDRAAGLDHRRVKARSLYCGGAPSRLGAKKAASASGSRA